MKTIPERIASIRHQMKDNELNAYIIPSTDPHQSEYLPDHWKVREWVSGFSGSAGTLVITMDFAGLWTDSRYFIQAEQELSDSGIELVKLKVPYAPEYIEWIANTFPAESKVGCDGKIFSHALVEKMKEVFSPKGILLNTGFDFVSSIWQDRPGLSETPVFEHEPEYAIIPRTEKLTKVRKEMSEKGIQYQLLTSLDDIAWLFNLRGNDVEYNPVFVAYAVVSQVKSLLFVNENKVKPALKELLEGDGITIKPYDEIDEFLGNLDLQSSISLHAAKVSSHIFTCIPSHVKIMDQISIPARLKACKTVGEIEKIKNAMIKDGIALVKFFRWLEAGIGKEEISESDIGEQLTRFRSDQQGYVGNSFPTIAGFKDHGAIVHYNAKRGSDYQIDSNGMLLIDSGGQYLDGTTDITRTIFTGEPGEEEIIDYTLVLRGLIRLSLAVFPEGTKGFHLDALARCPLWQKRKNYGHGTGHGVGYFLNVHEGPQGISPNTAIDEPLLAGMLQSNEPGYYPEGKYGIRLENLIVVKEDGKNNQGKFLQFETLTLFPFELELIDTDMLSEEEMEWLNRYHNKVFENLSPHLTREENQWLLKKTRWTNR
ncbi:MAG: aminopeptidase P family protein [Bacteroidota bacterium]